MGLDFIRKVPIPKLVKEEFPLTSEHLKVKKQRDEEIKKIFTKESNKFLVILGPCSADREKPVLDYACRLARLQDEVKDKMLLIPRIYTNKPRTLCNGYMGMMYQPNPDEQVDIWKGIIAIRKLHIRVIEESGMTSADEMLYPEDYRYVSDLLSYVAVGARSTENQQHRLTASGIDIPVGFKNPMSGSLDTMLNSIVAAQNSHKFLYRGWEVSSSGNPLAHAVLRGRTNLEEKNMPNYYFENLEELYVRYQERNLLNPSVIIDVNHSNSNKRALEQIRIAKEIMSFRNYTSEIHDLVSGLMIESYIEDGKQDITGNVYGQSVTDPCLGWEKTKRLIYDILDILG